MNSSTNNLAELEETLRSNFSFRMRELLDDDDSMNGKILAEMTGLSEGSISSYRNETNPTLPNLLGFIKIAQAFGISNYEYLINRECTSKKIDNVSTIKNLGLSEDVIMILQKSKLNGFSFFGWFMHCLLSTREFQDILMDIVEYVIHYRPKNSITADDLDGLDIENVISYYEYGTYEKRKLNAMPNSYMITHPFQRAERAFGYILEKGLDRWFEDDSIGPANLKDKVELFEKMIDHADIAVQINTKKK